ncbi:protein [Escherichia coli]|nr:protein [Escherichia coli]
MVCVVGRMRDLILQLSKSSIYSTKPFLGSIPWERKTVTPASLWHHPGLVLIHAEGVETPQPELTEAV